MIFAVRCALVVNQFNIVVMDTYGPSIFSSKRTTMPDSLDCSTFIANHSTFFVTLSSSLAITINNSYIQKTVNT